MKRLLLGCLVAGLLIVAAPTAEASDRLVSYSSPSPCDRIDAGYPVLDHLRYWSNRYWRFDGIKRNWAYFTFIPLPNVTCSTEVF